MALDERNEVYLDSHVNALATRVRRCSLLDLAKELLDIAWQGLSRQNKVNELGDNETIYLCPLRALIDKGKCPADLLIEKWEGEFKQDIRKLITYSAYKLP